MQAPKAEKQAHKLETKIGDFSDTRIDDYFWMKERDSQKVLDYLKSENAYTAEVLKPTETKQEQLFNEMKARIKEDDSTAPYKKDDYYYYVRTRVGDQYPLFCRKFKNLNGQEEVMIDVNDLAKGHSFYSTTGVSVSPNQKTLAFGADTVGRRFYTIYFKDLSTGKLLNDKIENVTGNIVWANDNKTLFYSKQHPETLRSNQVFRYELGSGKSTLIYEEKDETFDVWVSKTLSKKFIFIMSGSKVSNEARFISADKPMDEFKILQKRQRDHEYSVDDGGDRFFILTNLKAQNFRVMETPYDKTTVDHWKEVVPHNKSNLIQDITLFKNYLVLEERNRGLTQLHIINRKNNDEHYIQFKDEAYVAGMGSNAEFDTDVLRFEYESMTTPESVYDYNMNTRERALQKQKEILGGFDSEHYESKRLWAKSGDGAEIPISIVYRKGTKINEKTPLFLYGYGSYGYSLDPSFSSTRLSLVDRGFVFAIAHIRGGSEMGRYWYDNGKFLKKKNTFNDFVTVAEYLIKNKYTSPEHLYAAGGSAGGLLMGAVINMRPELFHGVIAAVPFVDVLTTMLDSSIPLTTGEYDEWGNPNEKAFYEYMKSYSPYDNVKAQEYPNLLVTTGYHDSQVQYWEPAKWVAKLRDTKTDRNYLLFKTEMDAGHSGKTGRFDSLKEVALEYAFILWLEDK